MPEFTPEDALAWLQLSIDKDCSVHKAIYYSLFFECQKDDNKYMRALEFFHNVYDLKDVQ